MSFHHSYQKGNIIDPAILLLGIYPGKNITGKDTHTLMLIVALFTKAESRKQLKCLLTDEWIRKIWCVYIMEYYSAIKNNEIMPMAATWMDLEIIILSEEKDRCSVLSFT